MRCAWWLAIGIACSSPPTAPPGGKETMRPDIHVKYQLAVLFWPGGGTMPVPRVFEEAQALYQQARGAYEANDYERAAADFARAASVLQVPADQPYADTAASNRAVLYRDAAYAWLMAGRAEAGRASLKQLRADGVASDGDLRQALEVLR